MTRGGGLGAGRTAPSRFGRYQVLRKIASGGMAEVYLCRLEGAEGFRKKVAVKAIRPSLSEEERFRALFAREARIAATCTHPNLVQVFDFGREGDACYLAMEYVEGANLAEALRRMRADGIRPPAGVWRYWVEGLLSGLGYLHGRGVIHRDISPSNVLLSRGGVVKINDFGIARSVRWEPTPAKGWEGKFAYMSPEQARGEEATFSTDLFAAAVVAAEVFLPGRLFGADSPALTLARLRDFDPAAVDFGPIPEAAADALRRALAPRPGDRYPSAEDFGRDVAAAVPSPAGRAELAGFWDSLFPAEPRDDEETTLADAPPTAGGSVLRESPGLYGGSGGRGVRIAIASAVVAAGIGGAVAWKMVPAAGPRDRPASPPASAVPERPGGAEGKGTGPAPSPAANDPVREGRAAREAPSAASGVASRAPAARPPADAASAPPAAAPAERGTIEALNAIPWARVYEGERELGVTPIRALSLPVGVHRLRLVNEPLGVDTVETVTVRPGVNPKVIVSLERPR